jgi:hypothetical protein
LLQRYDILCLRALLALRDGEFDLLALSKRFEAAALDCAEMREYVGSRFLFDETESFGFVKPFYRSGRSCHVCFLFQSSYESPFQGPFWLEVMPLLMKTGRGTTEETSAGTSKQSA